jgi:glycosyltransferase involved in cell wall biosynthesis
MSPESVPGLISVIIPTYNRASLIAASMDSVLVQTYRPIELIVVDDGSSDNTQEVVSEWALKADARLAVRYFHQANKGGCAARNRGLRESRGEFISFLDSDDRLLPRALQRKVDCLRAGNAPYCYDRGERVDGQGKSLGYHGRSWSAYGGLFFLTYHFDSAGPLIRRSLCIQVGPWHNSLSGSQEVEYFARLKLHGGRGIFLDEVGHVVVEHAGSRITNSLEYTRDALKVKELLLSTIRKAGPEFAHEATFLRGWLMLTHAQFAVQFHKKKDYRNALASLAKARQFGYCNWHVRAILAFNQSTFRPTTTRLYFSLRDLMHAVRCRVRRFRPAGGERDPVADLYKRLDAKQP